MTDDLIEIHERIEFCRGQTRGLTQEIKTYTDRAISVFEDTTEPPWHVLKAQLNEPVPISVRSTVGQIANELRACLDALACMIAIRNDKSTSGTYFPISKDATIFAEDGKKKTRKLSPSNQNKLLSFNTHGEAAPKLFGLHELDRTRKHIRLGLHTTGNSGVGIRNGGFAIFMARPGGRLEIGKPTAIAQFVPNGRAELDLKFSTTFYEPPQLAGLVVTETLDWFADEVQRIVSAFD